MSPEEMGEHRRGGIGVGQRVVRPHELNVVASAQVSEAMRKSAIGVEPARHGEGAQRVDDR